MRYRKPKGSAVGNGEGAASESTSEEGAPGETSFTVTKRRRIPRSRPLDKTCTEHSRCRILQMAKPLVEYSRIIQGPQLARGSVTQRRITQGKRQGSIMSGGAACLGHPPQDLKKQAVVCQNSLEAQRVHDCILSDSKDVSKTIKTCKYLSKASFSCTPSAQLACSLLFSLH